MQVRSPRSSMEPEPPSACLLMLTRHAGVRQSSVLQETWWPCPSALPRTHLSAATRWPLVEPLRSNSSCSLTLGAQVGKQAICPAVMQSILYWDLRTQISICVKQKPSLACGIGLMCFVNVDVPVFDSIVYGVPWQQEMPFTWTMRRIWQSTSCLRMDSFFVVTANVPYPPPGILARYQSNTNTIHFVFKLTSRQCASQKEFTSGQL